MSRLGLVPKAVAAGALVNLVIFAPLVLGLSILKHHDLATQESYFWVASAVAIFLAPLVGGAVAGRRGINAPLANGAAACALAGIAFLIFRVIDGAVGGRQIHAPQAVLYLIIAVSMGVVGAYFGMRRVMHATKRHA